MDISAAFLVLCWLLVTAGVMLLNVPAGLIVGGLLLGAAGVGMLTIKPRGERA